MKSKIFNIQLFLLIFLCFNRSFLFFGVDLRFVLLPMMSIYIIYTSNIRCIYSIKISEWLIIGLFVVSLFSNIAWLYNGLEWSITNTINLNILYIFNLIFALFIILNKDLLERKKINTFVYISGLFLILSIISSSMGFDLTTLGLSNYSGAVFGEGMNNFFGLNGRFSGFAQDPNHAAFSLALFSFVFYTMKTNRNIKILTYSLITLSLFLAGSKTGLIGIAIALCAVWILANKKFKKWHTETVGLGLLCLFLVIIVGTKINLFDFFSGSVSMGTRIRLWDYGVDMFLQHPIFGNGLGSFRDSFLAYSGGWNTYAHSTIIQVIAETGIIGLISLYLVFFARLNSRNKTILSTTLILLIYSINFDSTYQMFFIFVMCVIPLVYNDFSFDNKVLQIAGNMDAGGQETFVINMFSKIHDRCKFDFIVSQDGPYFYNSDIEKYGGKIFKVHHYNENMILRLRDLYFIQKNEQYKVVHRHTSSATVWIDLAFLKLFGCEKIITHSHSTSTENIKLHKLFQPLFNIISTERLSCSVDSGDWLFGNTSYTVIDNGIDIDKFEFNLDSRKVIRENLCLEGQTVLINVARLVPLKNQLFLVELISRLDESYKLVLIGDGPEYSTVNKSVTDRNLENKVIFIKQSKEINKYLSAADCFLLPSLYEGFPVSLIEAQVSGLNVICNDVIDKKIKLSKNLLFISIDDINNWVTAILRLPNDNRENSKGEFRDSVYDSIHSANSLLEIYKK